MNKIDFGSFYTKIKTFVGLHNGTKLGIKLNFIISESRDKKEIGEEELKEYYDINLKLLNKLEEWQNIAKFNMENVDKLLKNIDNEKEN